MKNGLNLDNLLNMKSLSNLNMNLIETVKQSIKQKNNEISLKLIENYAERPDLWGEFLRIAILSSNFPIVKHIIESFGLNVKENILINSSLINSEILNDTIINKENKDMYIDVEIPCIILSSIGGDIDIFSYLVEKGSNLNASGHITLSKKNRNSVISNVIGAAAYYGKTDLVNFILKKYKIDINFKAIERKSKQKHNTTLVKEFTDYSPLHLVIASEINEDQSIDIINLLITNGADSGVLDYSNNNILHQAVKYNKLRIVKHLVDNLKLYNEELNKDGQTPLAIAHINKFNEINEFLQSYSSNKLDNNELLELIVDNKKKKQKKKKKEATNNIILNTTEYEETLKIKPKKEIVKEIVEEKINDIEKLSNKDNLEVITYQEKQPYERKSYYNDYEYYNRYNYGSSRNNNGNYKDYNYKKNDYKKNDYKMNNYNDDRKFYKKNDYKETYDKTNKTNNNKEIDYMKGVNDYKADEKNDNIIHSKVKEKTDIIGLNVKNKKIKKKEEIINEEEPTPTEILVDNYNFENAHLIEENNMLDMNNKINDDNKIDEDEGGEDFLTEEEIIIEKETIPEVKNERLITTNNDEIMSKYIESQKNLEIITKEKSELEKYIINSLNNKIETSQNNINDLLELSNEELDKSSKIIAELSERIDFLEAKNIKSMNEKELNNLKSFYSSKLGIIIDALNNIKID